MNARALRGTPVTALVAAGCAAAAPAASADSLKVKTDVTVHPAYDSTALGPSKRDVDEAKGPVLLNVRHTIRCVRGKERRKGRGRQCQWSSALSGSTATVGEGQGMGDVYAARVSGYPQGKNFHAGYMAEGKAVTDDWAVVVRGDDLVEPDERFSMTVSATDGGEVVRDFTILDDESRRPPQ